MLLCLSASEKLHKAEGEIEQKKKALEASGLNVIGGLSDVAKMLLRMKHFKNNSWNFL